MENEKRIWGIHTQDDKLFLNSSVIAIGWNEMGDLNAIDPSREAFKDNYAQAYQYAKKGSVSENAAKQRPRCFFIAYTQMNYRINEGNVVCKMTTTFPHS